MAGAYQKAGKWYARFRDGTGVWRDKVLPNVTTKTEAKRLAVEFERHGWRQREGLEVLPSSCTLTLSELCDWWLKDKCQPLSRERETGRLHKNVCNRPIGAVPVPRVTAAMVDQHLDLLEREGLSPATSNHVRSILRVVFNRARKAGKWAGANPILDVERRREVKTTFSTLRAEEVPIFLAHVEEAWRPLFATALFTALRKGELFGLRKSDVDLLLRTITVARSYDHATTKGGHTDSIPIAVPLLPFLEAAFRAAGKSELVFPIAGKMGGEHEPLHRVLRKAMAAAGLVEGWDHICRRCKGKKAKVHTWRHPDAVERRCPNCTMRLWAKAAQRKIRFHDLRHTTATLLLQAKEQPHHVQRLLRHASITTTTGTYGHLMVEDLRGSLTALPQVAPPRLVGTESAEGKKARLAASLLQEPQPPQDEAGGAFATTRFSSPFGDVPKGIRTPVTGLKGAPWAPSESANETQPTANTRDADCTSVQILHTKKGLFSREFAASLLQDQPLTVREAARYLKLSEASVYALCQRRELRSFRVLGGQLRVFPSDLVAFLRSKQA